MTISSDRGKEWDWVLVSTANIQEMCVSVKSFSLLFQVRINPPTAVLWFVQFNELVKKWNPVKKTQFLKRTATQDHFHVELINCFVYKMSKKKPKQFLQYSKIPKLFIHFHKWQRKPQIFAFKKLEPANIWHVSFKQNWLKWLIDYQNSWQLIFVSTQLIALFKRIQNWQYNTRHSFMSADHTEAAVSLHGNLPWRKTKWPNNIIFTFTLI